MTKRIACGLSIRVPPRAGDSRVSAPADHQVDPEAGPSHDSGPRPLRAGDTATQHRVTVPKQRERRPRLRTSSRREVLVVGVLLQRPPHDHPTAANARTSTPPRTAMPGHTFDRFRY